MALTAQCPQARVHGDPALFGLKRKVAEQDSSRVIDIEHDTFCAVAGHLNHDWPFKSAQARSPLT